VDYRSGEVEEKINNMIRFVAAIVSSRFVCAFGRRQMISD